MKRIIFIYLFTFFSLLPLIAVPNATGVSLHIEETEKQIYTPATPIELQISVRNESPDPFLFELAADKVFNLELNVTNLYNETLPASEKYIRERSSNQQVYYREIRLLPGEKFSFFVEAADFVSLNTPGIYFIQADFSPHLENSSSLSSNTLTLHVQPSMDTESDYRSDVVASTRQVLQKHQLPPDQVVDYMLSARQNNEWEKFFLYLNVEQLMLQNPLKKATYRRSSDREQIRMVEEYREMLKNEMVDTDILLKPVEYKVLKTEYTPEEATVLVDQEFKYPDFTEKRRYMYYLHRPEGYWVIYNYQVLGQGSSE